jgi:transcriptional regulator GlxA family with amidase domain
MLLREIHELSCVGSLFVRDGGESVENIGVQKLHLDDDKLDKVGSTLERMLIEYAEKKTSWQASLLGHFLVFLAQIVRFTYSPGSKPDKPVSDRISRVLSYMRKNCHENISLKDLVKYSNMSLSSFMRSFTECMGTAPMNYLSELRLSKACSMLQSSELSISEIAMKCGYNDSNYFSRLFRKRLGLTPRKFRSLSNK